MPWIRNADNEFINLDHVVTIGDDGEVLTFTFADEGQLSFKGKMAADLRRWLINNIVLDWTTYGEDER